MTRFYALDGERYSHRINTKIQNSIWSYYCVNGDLKATL